MYVNELNRINALKEKRIDNNGIEFKNYLNESISIKKLETYYIVSYKGLETQKETFKEAKQIVRKMVVSHRPVNVLLGKS